MPRHGATSSDQYSLNIEDALLRYQHAGHPRTPRSIQRYCVKGHLDCLRQETTFGDRFLITPESVARHIAQIDEIASATRRDMTRPVGTQVEPFRGVAPAGGEVATSRDTPRPDATSRDLPAPETTALAPTPPADNRYVMQLERENDFLRDQVQRKDTQIGELTERAKETNFLIKGLQDLVLRLQPARPRDDRDMDTAGEV